MNSATAESGPYLNRPLRERGPVLFMRFEGLKSATRLAECHGETVSTAFVRKRTVQFQPRSLFHSTRASAYSLFDRIEPGYFGMGSYDPDGRPDKYAVQGNGFARPNVARGESACRLDILTR